MSKPIMDKPIWVNESLMLDKTPPTDFAWVSIMLK